MNSLITNLNEILNGEDVDSTPEDKLQQITLALSTATATFSAKVTVTSKDDTGSEQSAPHEVAILKLELQNLKEKMNVYHIKISNLVSFVTTHSVVLQLLIYCNCTLCRLRN
jgi:hypothetical protein